VRYAYTTFFCAPYNTENMINRNSVIRAVGAGTAGAIAFAATGNPAVAVEVAKKANTLIDSVPDDWWGRGIAEPNEAPRDGSHVMRQAAPQGNLRHAGNAILYGPAMQRFSMTDWGTSQLGHGERATIGVDVVTSPGISQDLIRPRMMNAALGARPRRPQQVY
jgi:hypothetical protein